VPLALPVRGGVNPDIAILHGVDDLTAHDPTLEAALNWLRKK
jgi:hypothetical protein